MSVEKARIEVKQAGQVYVFQINALISPSEKELIRQRLQQQIKEGCVLLDGRINLISLKTRRKAWGNGGKKMGF